MKMVGTVLLWALGIALTLLLILRLLFAAGVVLLIGAGYWVLMKLTGEKWG